MARDILSEFGPESPKDFPARATCGGVTEAKELPYSSPVGPINLNKGGPGLKGGVNTGEGQRHGEGDTVIGSAGLHDHNYGNCGTQGKR